MEATEHANLREAADLLGVAVVTLRRRIRSNALPEAELEEGDHGEEWRIPRNALPAIAEREGWTLDLTNDTAEVHLDNSPGLALPRELLERLLDAERTSAEAVTKADAAERALRQATGDLEYERAERQRLEAALRDTTAELHEASQARAVAEARAEETAKAVERLTADLDASRAAAEHATNDLNETQSRADDLTTQLEHAKAAQSAAEASLGWLGRRRLAKRQPPN